MELSAVSVQVAFLLCESLICLGAAVVLIANRAMNTTKRRLLVAMNLAAFILLISDFCAYIFRGVDAALNFWMVRIANANVFIFSDVCILLYISYLTYMFFNEWLPNKNVPCRKRLIAIDAVLLLLILSIIVSQFNGMYYSFTPDNLYVRGPLFIVSMIVPALTYIPIISVLIQYRKTVSRNTLVLLSTFVCMPLTALIIQTFYYGLSLINICTGICFIIMFAEASISQGSAVIMAQKTEVRTGLANEHGCIERLNELIVTNEIVHYAAVFFDLAKFSKINTKYGMDFGTKVIVTYAGVVSKHLEEDEFIAREVSDQFIAVIEKKNVDRFLEFLRGTKITVETDGEPVEIEISATAGVFPIDATCRSGEEIIANAFSALLYAKSELKKSVAYLTPELKASMDEQRLYEEMILTGLKNEEFLAYYQPKVNSEKKRLCGAEALVRWMHDGQLISPGKFIPILEKNDYMMEMDFYVLRHVCRDIAKWVAQGLVPPTISVNFSRRGLVDPNLAQKIDEIVTSSHVPKKLIEIEITETIDEFPISVLKSFIDELHRLGYRVAVDDFGCGSSSLSLLREVTFDTLKIDKGFVDRAYAKDLTILSYMIKLAKAIGLEVLAEGVEQSEQVETLQKFGCDVIQGYYYDKPLPIGAFESRITDSAYYREK
jgi:diguanylate cyclase (GGDEF)-like protein